MLTSPNPTLPAISADSLTLGYSENTGIFDVTFAVSQGITVLAGNNGAGKTTLLETLSGLRRPISGSARIFGLDPHIDRDKVTFLLGVALQEVTPYPTARPRELLSFIASLYPQAIDPDLLIEQFSIPGSRTIKSMSGGEVQRMKCAMALIGSPRAVILDEPTAGLDPGARADLYRLLRERASEGIVLLVSTHLTEDIDALADRALVLRNGRLTADFTPMDFEASEYMQFKSRPNLPLDQLLTALPHGTEAVPMSNGEYRLTSNSTIDSSIIATVASWCSQHETSASDFSVGRQTMSSEVLRHLGMPSTSRDST